MIVSHQRTSLAGIHSQYQVAVLVQGFTTRYPVALACVAQVLGVGSDGVDIIPLVRLAFAYRLRNARVQGEGRQRVAATETVGTYATLAIRYGNRLGLAAILSEKEAGTGRVGTRRTGRLSIYLREQQGVFSGHFWLGLHSGVSSAAAPDARAAAASAKAQKRAMMKVKY